MKSNLKQFRNDAGLTIKQLSEQSYISSPGIHLLETGKRSPMLLSAYALAKILNKTVYEIWPDDTEIIEETTVTKRVVNRRAAKK